VGAGAAVLGASDVGASGAGAVVAALLEPAVVAGPAVVVAAALDATPEPVVAPPDSSLLQAASNRSAPANSLAVRRLMAVSPAPVPLARR
jgi:hypothetical protein